MPQPNFDPYATLGVHPGADPGRVQEAYRRLARENHPDHSSDRGATERMKRINRAWEILSNPSRRAQYDADTAVSRRATSAGHWSAPPRRSARWAAPPPAWSATTYPGYQATAASYDDEERPSWLVTAGVLVLMLVLGPLLFTALPVPFFGLWLLLAAGWASRHLG